MAKKIMALVMTIAMVACFAVGVSAISVTPTTAYVGGDTPQADVTVRVSGVEAGNNVTYYAKNTNGDVYVDQKKVAEGATSVEFNFLTAYTNVNSAAVVGYTNDDTAEASNIPEAGTYSISFNGGGVGSVYVGQTTATVTIKYTAPAHETVTGINATNATVSTYLAVEEGYSVTLSNISGNVELTVVTEDIEIPDYEAQLEIVEVAAIVVKADAEGNVKNDVEIKDGEEVVNENATAAEGNKKLTVCCTAGDWDEYGVIVSESAITAGTYWADEFAYSEMKYKANGKADDGKFAVQLIDTGAEFVKTGTDYHTAVYGYNAEKGIYKVVSYASTVAANQ